MEKYHCKVSARVEYEIDVEADNEDDAAARAVDLVGADDIVDHLGSGAHNSLPADSRFA